MSAAKTPGLVGRKAGMTRVFNDAGESVPVTVIQALPNRITQVRTVETDGYRAVQVAHGERKASHLSKALAGHYAKVKVAPGTDLVEFRLTADAEDFTAGTELKVDMFEAGQVVDVVGTTVGKGFAGTMKRHGFAGQGASHGTQAVHRRPGSIGGCATPGRVFKGTRMAGRMGNERVTTLNLKVHKVDAENGVLLIKGAIPGRNGGLVMVRSAIKRGDKK